LRGAREWAVEQAFASYEFQHRERQSDAASGFHFSDQGTRAVAFKGNAWFAMNKGEDALKDAVDLGVVFARETTSGSAASFSNGIASFRRDRCRVRFPGA
jgi:hypothetical protein